MLHISHKPFIVGEPCRQLFGTRHKSTAIVADVHDKSVARGKIHHHVVKIALPIAFAKDGQRT